MSPELLRSKRLFFDRTPFSNSRSQASFYKVQVSFGHSTVEVPARPQVEIRSPIKCCADLINQGPRLRGFVLKPLGDVLFKNSTLEAFLICELVSSTLVSNNVYSSAMFSRPVL